jgi:hypothetical protein
VKESPDSRGNKWLTLWVCIAPIIWGLTGRLGIVREHPELWIYLSVALYALGILGICWLANRLSC